MSATRRKKVERRLEQLGRNPAWLARELKKNKQSVYQWLEGRAPRDESVWPKIARLLDIPIEVLMDDARDLPTYDEVTLTKPQGGLRSFASGDMALLPVWRGVAAGLADECYFVPSDSSEFLEVPAFLAGRDPDRYIVCVAAGTSMSPRLRQGDKAVVRLDPNPPRNSLVVAQNPEGRRFIKALREKKALELHSLNENFAPIRNVSGWQLVGSVVAIWGEYEPGSANIEWDGGRPLKG